MVRVLQVPTSTFLICRVHVPATRNDPDIVFIVFRLSVIRNRSSETDTSLFQMGEQHKRDYARNCGLFLSAEGIFL